MITIKTLTLLKYISYIDYLISFWKDPASLMSALIDSNSKVNTMQPAYAKKLDLNIRKTNMEAQKIDNTTLKIFEKVIAAFSIHNKARKVCFFEETFLLADISIDVALRIFFFILSNANIYFTNQELYWRTYSMLKALPTTCRIELINQKEFAMAALGKDNKTLIMHMAFLAVSTEMTIHFSQIS